MQNFGSILLAYWRHSHKPRPLQYLPFL